VTKLTDKELELIEELASGFQDMLELVRMNERRIRTLEAACGHAISAREEDRCVVLIRALEKSRDTVAKIMRDGL
jgi:hypothetical protein